MANEPVETSVHKLTRGPHTRRAARLQYYQGIRKGMLEHIQITESNLRKLEGVTLILPAL